MLFGGAGNDTLTGAQANDTLTGGAGVDVFQFGLNHAADRVTDFTPDVDKFSLITGSIGVTRFADLTIADNAGGNAVITFEDSPTTAITVAGVSAIQLDAGDFFFS
jgi:Ca2+-binding RTX toxin-like protein